MKLEISSSVRQNLLGWAAASPDAEICGLLVGRGTRVERLVPARNVSADPARSFEIDPATLLAAHREARGAGQQVIGHWHSHPNGHSAPSARDAARASQNGQIWVILAAGTLTAWVARSTGPGPAQFDSVAVELY
ncbi:MAG: M67 family metallopeptidase [Alphaproteobacteria bacterium]|nr:M67 family metallopeptidase [Alphaproteobacteria bacterium]